MGFQEYIAFTILVPCLLSMWLSQLSLCTRMKSAIAGPKPGWERRKVSGWLGPCRIICVE
jgi:hypothetical protein